MRANNTNKTRQFSSLLNEHWKRKQRLKVSDEIATSGCCSQDKSRSSSFTVALRLPRRRIRTRRKKAIMIDVLRAPKENDSEKKKKKKSSQTLLHAHQAASNRWHSRGLDSNSNAQNSNKRVLTPSLSRLPSCTLISGSLIHTPAYRLALWSVLLVNAMLSIGRLASGQSASSLHSDPRPTIYSGQVSFGLLLSAHSSFGNDLPASASQQVRSQLALPASMRLAERASGGEQDELTSSNSGKFKLTNSSNSSFAVPIGLAQQNHTANANGTSEATGGAEAQLASDSSLEEIIEFDGYDRSRDRPRWRQAHKRQIFERAGQYRRGQQAASSGESSRADASAGLCSQVNANALYAGMGAIWASHQANLVGDSHLAIGTYVYDSCNDLNVGQRQSVRIVSNLNAFQQTTCESPRGSPISLTIAHGDNQLHGIQLLTSFKVPVIITKEHYALEGYDLLTHSQRKYLFSTAHSSKQLAVGALHFSRKIVRRSTASPKLANREHQMSSKNGLIVISEHLPDRFRSYLLETIPTIVNYEMLQTLRPIDDIQSVKALESILIKKDSSSSSASSSSSSSSPSTAASESRQSRVSIDPPAQIRPKRTTDSDSDSSDGSGNEYESSGVEPDSRMLSPTILMFITPSEAIDLVTRLRNDLAEVSKYFSLIVTTREDISPALKTIFHRGGSRLCSGKAFYTISPKPDDIGEFSRYFRDTVQMEGETSDHPLVCEFAKYQSATKVTADLDDISTEPVIKAVWSAAAAFKKVHRQECPSLTGSPASGNIYRSPGSNSGGAGNGGGGSTGSGAGSSGGLSSQKGGELSDSVSEGRTLRQLSKSAHSECMVKMNKNLAHLVQRALRTLDVTINSTGLQSLDGFRLRFDPANELMTNKFSIKYINKECEITEIGQFSGLKDSTLYMHEQSLVKSLESTLPDPWPVTVTPAPTPPPAPVASQSTPAEASTSSSGDTAKDSTSSSDGADSSSGNADSDSVPSTNRARQRKQQQKVAASESNQDDAKQSADDEDSPGSSAGSSDGDKSDRAEVEAPKRTSKRSRYGEPARWFDERLYSRRKLDQAARRRKHQQQHQPVTAMGGRGIMPGVTDTDIGSEPEGTEPSSDRTPSASSSGAQTSKAALLASGANEHRLPLVGGLLSDGSSAQPKQVRRLKSYASTTGTTLRDWLPNGATFPSLSSTYRPVESAMTRNPELHFLSAHPISGASQYHDNEQVVSPGAPSSDLKSRATTQAPVYSTLPESGGNADLDQPPTRSLGRITQSITGNGSAGKTLDTAATTESSDYVTLSSISKNVYDNQPHSQIITPTTPAQFQNHNQLDYHYEPMQMLNGSHTTTSGPQSRQQTSSFDIEAPRSNYLKDLNSSPIPLSSPTLRSGQISDNLHLADAVHEKHSASSDSNSKDGRSTLRSHLGWIYSGWFGIIILGANIVGALLTLYVLTFLLMKNCDGSLDRENQGIRSMHLLAIIVVFFGSTLFIVYPTPGLCLLRSSWHNFALVMLFGTLLLQAMQTRSLSSLGLGGRPNRLNQFLTLLFIIGVQVSFELQRWKYESANYMNFVNQYFGSSSESSQKLLSLSSAVANQFNPLNSFNDQITPVSIQVSEHYQNLLHDYCMQQADDFLQSQIYLCTIVILLVIFSASTRNSRRLAGTTSASSAHHKLASALTTSGKLVASQHEANLTNISPSHFQFASNGLDAGNMFMVTLVTVPIYSVSIILHLYGQNSTNRDLISSVTMILIAFSALIGIFLPILLQIHRYDGLVSDRLPGTLTRPVITQSKLQDGSPGSSSSNAFSMFPEFAPTGLRRPSSTSGESSSGAGCRRPFADTKESRRNMGAALANLGPTVDSLRSMGFYEQERNMINPNEPIDPALLNLKLNLSANEDHTSNIDDLHPNQQQHQHHHHHHNQTTSAKRSSKGEKRLIMLDVDPCCPRHGVAAARPRASEYTASKSSKSRTSHCH